MIPRLPAALLASALAACSFDGAGVEFDDGGTGDATIADSGTDADPSAPDAGDPRTTLGIGDMRLIYGEVSSDRIRNQRWSATELDWTSEPSTFATSGNPIWLVNQVTGGGDPDELIAASLATASGHTLAAYSWDGEQWDLDWDVATTSSEDSKRSYDLAVEASGDALAVFATDTQTPSYRTRVGGVWSAAIPLPINDGGGPNPDTNAGLVDWVELEARPGTDQIALAFVDSMRNLVALIWDGDQWLTASARLLDPDVKMSSVTGDVANRAFDLAFETQSGDLIVAWGQNSQNQFWYQQWTAQTGTWLTSAVRESSTVSGFPHYIDLAPDPDSDRIAAAFYDLGDGTERLGLAMWSGTDWQDKGEVDSQIRNVEDQAIGDMPGQLAWMPGLNVAICIFADDAPGTLDWVRWESGNGWQVQNPIAFAGKGYTESATVRLSPGGQRLVVLVSDENLRLFATTYNGSSWQLSNQGAPLTTVLASSDAVAFSLAVRR